ncbi:MAG TPA: Dickkopf N-terminal cysteine-rich domain-containing protein [Kofleriaceae bacterium]|nr:Dickkopf N-terminal cysteine-rich domain-containing protein [Kofleriaceae bacterium]
MIGSGCGGGGGRPSVSTSQDTVCDDVADVACYNMYQCCAESEIERFLGVSDPRTEEECRDDVRVICERQLATIDFSIKNKRVRFDAAVMDTCLKAIEAPADTCATIDSMAPWTAACMDGAFVGTVETGAQCDFAYECAKDNTCNASRLCAALPGDGMACLGQTCASGLFCNAGTCRPQIASGGTCASTAQCQKGLFCDTAGTRTCTPLHAVGERCTGNATCVSNTCLPGMCADTQATCFSSATCGGKCEDDQSPCSLDSTCALGTCSGPTPNACFSNTDCVAPNTCVFPVKCVHTECVGDVVCADPHVTVDYCQGAINALPFF